MLNLLRVSNRQRVYAGVIGIFVSILGVYVASYLIIGMHSIGVTIAFAGALLVFVIRRWRPDAQLSNIEAMVNLSPLRMGYVLPSSGMALDGASLLSIVSHIIRSDVHSMVECGSGVSTIVIGNLFKGRGDGHLFSLEEDENWFEQMQTFIAAQGLDDYVTLLYAPITDWAGVGRWYDRSVAQLILDRFPHIDLLLVDGPQRKNKQSRYGALPYFGPILDASSLVILHDLDRKAERTVLERWRIEFGAVCESTSGTENCLGHIRLAQPPPRPDAIGDLSNCVTIDPSAHE
jgi:predicted O-methyltransferase YrrM